jgi:hypothetical protein
MIKITLNLITFSLLVGNLWNDHYAHNLAKGIQMVSTQDQKHNKGPTIWEG